MIQAAGNGPLTDLWSDGVARRPDFLLGWDTDGDGDDKLWAFADGDYYTFDWSTQQFGAPLPLTSIGVPPLFRFDGVTKYRTPSGRDLLVATDGGELFLYNPTLFLTGQRQWISDFTSDGSLFAPEFLISIDSNLDSVDDLFLVDIETDAVWKWNPATGKLEKEAGAFSTFWPGGIVRIDPGNGDFFLAFKGQSGSSGETLFALEHN